MSAIFWGTVLLFLSLLVWSLMAVVFIHPLNKNVDYGDCSRCPRAYSSVMQASLTFWQQIITGDSWGQASIPLIEKHPITAIYFVLVFLSVGLAVMNLILGVVVSVAQQAKDKLEEEDAREKVVLGEEHNTHLLELCMDMDKEGTGKISQDSLHQLFETPGPFRDALLSVDATREELNIIWKLVDTEQAGAVPYEDVVSAIYKMQGSDTQYMLAYIKHYITLVSKTIEKQMQKNHGEELRFQERVEEDLRKIEQVETLEFGAWQALAANQIQRCDGPDNNRAGEVISLDQSKGMVAVKQIINRSQEGPLLLTNTNVAQNAKLAATNIDMDAWLKHVCQRIAGLQAELQDIWKDMDGKVEPAVRLVPVPDKVLL